MESPRNTTRNSPSTGRPSFAFASRYLARLGQSRSCDSIACRSRFRDSQGSAGCCAGKVCRKNMLESKTNGNFIMKRDTSCRIVLVTEKSGTWALSSDVETRMILAGRASCLLFGSPTALIYHPRLEPNGVPSVEASTLDVQQ